MNSILEAIIDRNLYGRSFFYKSSPFIIIGLVIQCFVLAVFNPQLIIVYVPFYIGLIIVSALATKNIKREFHPMGIYSAYMVFFAAILAETYAFTAHFENTWKGILDFLVVLGVSLFVFIFSLITIIVLGQRNSLRNSLGLRDDFFWKEKKRLKEELKNFPNLDHILEGLDNARFVANLFDKGLFNLMVLWSCNVMEEIVNAITNEIIARFPKKKELFRREDGFFLPYPKQLRNLGFEVSSKKEDDNKQIDIETLWREIRNKIAHYNYRPTYFETSETIRNLISFMKEMPEKLKSSNLFNNQESSL
jgi:hypothetical protein